MKVKLCCAQITSLKAALKEVPEETKGNVEKKQARTYEELLAEQAEQEEVGVPMIDSSPIATRSGKPKSLESKMVSGAASIDLL